MVNEHFLNSFEEARAIDTIIKMWLVDLEPSVKGGGWKCWIRIF